jgi:hypothetical protein
VILARQSTAAKPRAPPRARRSTPTASQITSLTFNNPGGNARRIDIALTGRLRNAPAYMSAQPVDGDHHQDDPPDRLHPFQRHLSPSVAPEPL